MKELTSKLASRFKPMIYGSQVDSAFLRLCSKFCIAKFPKYLNHLCKSVRFTSKTYREYSILFLDIKINKYDNRFRSSVYQKLTFVDFLSAFKTSFVNCIIKDFCLLYNRKHVSFTQTLDFFIRRLIS